MEDSISLPTKEQIKSRLNEIGREARLLRRLATLAPEQQQQILRLTGTGPRPAKGTRLYLVESPNGALSPYDTDRLQTALESGDPDAIQSMVDELGVTVKVLVAVGDAE